MADEPSAAGEAELDGLGAEELRERLRDAVLREARQKEKMQQWKAKMTDIVEKERGELKKLREEKAAWDADRAALEQRSAALDAEVSALRGAALSAAQLRLSARERETGASPEALADRVAALESELAAAEQRAEEAAAERARTAADFELYKQRTSAAMRLRSREVAGGRDRVSGVEEELRAAQRDLAAARRDLAQRDADLRRAEELGRDAAEAVARERERAAAAAALLERRHEADSLELLQRARDDEARLREQYELRLQSQQQLHESELAEMQVQLAEYAGQARLQTQQRVDRLLEEAERLREQLAERDEELAALRRQLRDTAAAAQRPADGGGGDEAVRLRQRAGELEAEREQQGRRVWELQQQLLELRAAPGAAPAPLRRAPSPEAPGAAAAPDKDQQAYLRAVVVEFFSTDSEDVQRSLLPVLAALLRLGNPELKAIYRRHPEFMSH